MSTAEDERNQAIVAAVRGGESYRSIGGRYGISAARVGQIVARLDPDAPDVGEEARALARQRAREASAPPPLTKKCPVCSRTFQTRDRRRTTCTGILPPMRDQSDECSVIYHARDWQLSPAASRARQGNVARHILRNADRYPAVRVRWARKFLDENPDLREPTVRRSRLAG